MKNSEIFQKVVEAFSLDTKYHIAIEDNVNDLESGKIKTTGLHPITKEPIGFDVGNIKSTADIIIFNIWNMQFRIVKYQNGFQALQNTLCNTVSYTSLPDYSEIVYADNEGTRMVFTDQNRTLGIQFISKNNEYVNPNGTRPDIQESRITLFSSEDSICYEVIKGYHTGTIKGYSSGPYFEYRIDTLKKYYKNTFSIDNKDIGSVFNGSLEDANLMVADNLANNPILNGIKEIEFLSDLKLSQNIDLKFKEIMEVNENKK